MIQNVIISQLNAISVEVCHQQYNVDTADAHRMPPKAVLIGAQTTHYFRLLNVKYLAVRNDVR